MALELVYRGWGFLCALSPDPSARVGFAAAVFAVGASRRTKAEPALRGTFLADKSEGGSNKLTFNLTSYTPSRITVRDPLRRVYTCRICGNLQGLMSDHAVSALVAETCPRYVHTGGLTTANG